MTDFMRGDIVDVRLIVQEITNDAVSVTESPNAATRYWVRPQSLTLVRKAEPEIASKWRSGNYGENTSHIMVYVGKSKYYCLGCETIRHHTNNGNDAVALVHSNLIPVE